MIPYPSDLIRLATSVRLDGTLHLEHGGAADAILRGYRVGLKAPRPTLLDERELWMRDYVACSDKERSKFWSKMDKDIPTAPPEPVKQGFLSCLPPGAQIDQFSVRLKSKGGGSLGRPRFQAIASWRGGRIAREAKALVTSGWDWAQGITNSPNHFMAAATGPNRSPDPYLEVASGFIFRRLAADARKIERSTDFDGKLDSGMLTAMGFDIGSFHAASDALSKAISDHLSAQSKDWLHGAAEKAAELVKEDYDEWCDTHPSGDKDEE